MISIKNSIRILIGCISLVILFHILVVFKIIPYSIAWGGRLKTDQEMYVFESVSMMLNLFLIWVLLLKAKNSKAKFVTIILWIFLGLFFLNTIGNIFAKTNFEKSFSVVTLLFTLLILRILVSGKTNQPETTKGKI